MSDAEIAFAPIADVGNVNVAAVPCSQIASFPSFKCIAEFGCEPQKQSVPTVTGMSRASGMWP